MKDPMTTAINVANMAGFQFSGLDNQVENILLPLKQRIQDNGERLFVNLCYVDFRGGELRAISRMLGLPGEFKRAGACSLRPPEAPL